MHYKHFTPTERGQVQAFHNGGKSLGYIAGQLGRDKSSISRELRRNAGRDGYDAAQAQKLYEQRREPCRPRKRLEHPPLRCFVFDKITSGWTPGTIKGRLPLLYPQDPQMRISHETLYQAIYDDPKMRCLIKHLPQARPKRRKRGQGKSRRGPLIPNRTSIHERPKEVEERSHYGHIEGDTIYGLKQKGFLTTLVERKSRYTLIRKTQTKQADEVAQAVINALMDMPADWVKSITFDNGTEFTQHETIAKELGVDIFFADPYSSWQRGTNENTNGLIRRYLPKKTDFRNITDAQIQHIEEELNNRPRKILGYRTPHEVFMELHPLRAVALST
jgi:IS30 family transposase